MNQLFQNVSGFEYSALHLKNVHVRVLLVT